MGNVYVMGRAYAYVGGFAELIKVDWVTFLRQWQFRHMRQDCRSCGVRNFVRMAYEKNFYVYILASRRNGTLYTGTTNNLRRRVSERKHGIVDRFTKKHNVHILVYYEHFPCAHNAIRREKQLKHWKRVWKLRIIEEQNPQWRDMYEDWQNPRT